MDKCLPGNSHVGALIVSVTTFGDRALTKAVQVK